MDVIRATSPAEVLALVPYRLGFQPAESLVMLSVRADTRLGVLARVDLPALAATPGLTKTLAAHMTNDGAPVMAMGSARGWPSRAGGGQVRGFHDHARRDGRAHAPHSHGRPGARARRARRPARRRRARADPRRPHPASRDLQPLSSPRAVEDTVVYTPVHLPARISRRRPAQARAAL